MDQQRHSYEEGRYVNKLFRCFVLRSIQVILQSRASRLFRCVCRDHSSVEMLGLSLEDDPQIALSVKHRLAGLPDLRHGDAVSVQVFLTCSENIGDGRAVAEVDGAEGERLYLEVWTFRYADENDPQIRRAKAFDRLTVALKALWSVARALPAYRVARREVTERRVLCYRLLAGAADPAVLGPGYQNRRVASVRSLAGTLSLTCSFRSPIRIGPESMRLDEAHYQMADSVSAEDTVDTVDAPVAKENVESILKLEQPMSISASVEEQQQQQQQQKEAKLAIIKQSIFCPAGPFANGYDFDVPDGGVGDYVDFVDDLPFSSLVLNQDTAASGAEVGVNDEDDGDIFDNDDILEQEGPCELSAELSDGEDNVAENDADKLDNIAAAVSATQLSQPTIDEAAGKAVDDDAEDAKEATESYGVLSEYMPFASDSSAADLQRLEQLKSAVRLEMFATPPPLVDRIGDIPRQLEFFERDLADFDRMLNNMLERSSDSEAEEL